MSAPCPVCRALPKGLRDWLLSVFAAGDLSDPLYPVALDYARWGAARVARGEAKPFPLLQHHPGKLDPFEVTGAWLELARAHNARRRLSRGKIPKLERTPAMLRELAGRFETGECTIEATVARCFADLAAYGPRVGLALLVKTNPTPASQTWTVTELPDGGILAVGDPDTPDT